MSDDDVLLSGPIEQFFAARRTRKDSPNTIRVYRTNLANVCSQLAAARGIDANQLTVADLALPALRAAFGTFADSHAKKSVALAWSTWNQFFNFLVAEGIQDGNPMAAIPRPRIPRSSPKPLAGEDSVAILLKTAATKAERGIYPWPERDLAVIATLLVTGLRSAELLTLTVGSIHGMPGERRVTVVGKGDKPRTIPVENPLYEVIDDYLQTRRARHPTVRLSPASPLFVNWKGQPLTRSALRYLVDTTLRRAGLSGQRPVGAMVHSLRHTYATRLAENGASATEIMNLLGHASLSTSQTYIDSTAGEQRAAAAVNPTYQDLAHIS